MSKSLVSFKKRTNQLTEVVFKFNREIIDVIKTIPDFFYENKKWFIPADKKIELQDKIQLLQLIKDDDEKENEKKILKRKLDFDEIDQSKKIKVLHSINVKFTKVNELTIKLPVSKFVFAKLMNCADLVIMKDGKNAIWKIIGKENIERFNECCVSNNIHLSGQIPQLSLENSNNKIKDEFTMAKSEAIMSDDDIVFIEKFPAQSFFKSEPLDVAEIQDSQTLF